MAAMGLPAEYEGREQTWLKHQVLRHYLRAWAQKMGSLARYGPVTLWYVDCFAGPWEAQSGDLADTSVAIGLDALREAQERWKDAPHGCSTGAIFVEKGAAAFNRLETFLATSSGTVKARAFRGEFGDHIEAIKGQLGADPAFLFVDPTGWKGAAMRFIAPLSRPEKRDVLVNVMIHHMLRFKDDRRTFLRDQMREFFGLKDSDLPVGLSEEKLIKYYRRRLGESCGLKYVADLIVPDPTSDKTRFRLVLGTHHSEGLRLFRESEYRVLGKDAAPVRQDAKNRKQFVSTGGQGVLFAPEAPSLEARYASLRAEGLETLRAELPGYLKSRGQVKYQDLWPDLLLQFHVAEGDLRNLLVKMKREGKLETLGAAPGDRGIKDEHRIQLTSACAQLQRRSS